ncbi:hypothetical protein [Hyphomicrobium sp. CS1BSMeth3]|jgi:ribose/xylose/arabinose/galactoside ABC-type transport system permease subunit|uniref:hypothetical protein n=1 Tax=Hyphomicrobium sp. CS1BSMeth3 TaxID=1892844 RepID=UPI000930A017|nr:hypothetical protein [Hyphomicrobium sp. CS1BSMeth3]
MPLGQRLTILLKVLGVFLLMGPPVGALTFFAGMGVYGVSQTGDIASVWWLSLFGLIYGVPLSYLMGIAPAAAAGFILGAAAALHRTPGFLFSIATGFLVGLWLVYAGGSSIAPPSAETASDNVPAILLIATCLVPTVLCWALARCIIRRMPASSSCPVATGHPPG